MTGIVLKKKHAKEALVSKFLRGEPHAPDGKWYYLRKYAPPGSTTGGPCPCKNLFDPHVCERRRMNTFKYQFYAVKTLHTSYIFNSVQRVPTFMFLG